MASTDYTAAQNAGSSYLTQGSGIRESDRNATGTGSFSNTPYYAMRGVDADAGTLTYRSWVVSDSPDLTGALYGGTKSGGSPLTNIQIVAKWTI
jgi:hypothetical protein